MNLLTKEVTGPEGIAVGISIGTPGLKRGSRRTRTPMARKAAREAQFVAAHAYDPFPTAFINPDATVHSNMAWEDLPPDVTSFLLEEVQRPAIQIEEGLAISALEAARSDRKVVDCPAINLDDGSRYRMVLKSVPQMHNGQTVSVTAVDMTQDRRREEQDRRREEQDRRREEAMLDIFRLIVHDLRTPITGIKGYAQLLERRLENEVIEKLGEYAHTIADTAGRMGEKVTGALDMVDIVRKNPDLVSEEVSASDFLKAAILNNQEIKVAVAAKGITLTVALPNPSCRIAVFPIQTESIITYVIGNAIDAIVKKGGEDRVIDIRCEESEKLLKVYFKDTGIGIAQDRFESILEGDTDKGVDGTGIGLTEAKKYLRALGGNIYVVESTLGKGTTICAALPLSR